MENQNNRLIEKQWIQAHVGREHNLSLFYDGGSITILRCCSLDYFADIEVQFLAR